MTASDEVRPEAVPGAVLFACSMNRVRSPMAAGLMRARLPGRVFVDSCGVDPAEGLDPFVVAVMAERSIDLSKERPKTFEAAGADGFDLIVCLTEEARRRAEQIAKVSAVALEYWPVEDPTLEGGGREQRLEAYRRVRDLLDRKIADRFGGLRP